MSLPMWNWVKTSKLRKLYDPLPSPVKRVYRLAFWYPYWLYWRYHPSGYEHARKLLGPLRDRYKGCRGIIIGNGPSLRKTNWDLLRDEYTFGLNRIYLLREEMGFEPTFYLCIKDLVLQQFTDEIRAVGALKFLDWRSGRSLFESNDNTVFIPRVTSESFRKDVLTGWNPGATVTSTAMQLAYFLGFSQVILIGVDHHFVTQGPAAREVVSEGPDPNHFSPNYFGKGIRWQLPDMEGMERMYRLAKKAYEDSGRQILDATVGGKLDVFPKTALERVLADTSFRNATQ